MTGSFNILLELYSGMKSIFVFSAFLSSLTISAVSQQSSLAFAQKIKSEVTGQFSVNLVLNQHKLVPGDTVLFRTYVSSHHLISPKGRIILSACLMDQRSRIVQRTNFVVRNGTSTGQLIIPSKLQSGLYALGVFNPAQKKKDTVVFLNLKRITIVDKQKIVDEVIPTSVSFSPEGGQLIAGVNNSLVVTSPYKGLHRITDEQGSEVLQFQGDPSGFTKVSFKPGSPHSYFLSVNNKVYPIKDIEPDGCAMKLFSTSESSVVELRTPVNSKLRNEELYLEVSDRTQVQYKSKVLFDSGGGFRVDIPTRNLSRGVSQLQVIRKPDQVIASRFFYVKKNNCSIQTKLNQEKYSQRDKVEVDINFSNGNGRPAQGDFVISVVNQDLLGDDENITFEDEAFIGSLIGKDRILTPERVQTKWIDNYMITQSTSKGWPSNDLGNSKRDESISFNTNLNITGHAVFKSTGLPVPDSTLITTYLLKAMTGYEAYTDKEGAFKLNFLLDFAGEDDLFYSLEKNGMQLKDNYILKLDSFLFPLLRYHVDLKVNDSIDLYADYESKRKIVNESFIFFQSKTQNEKPESLNFKFEDELMGSDFTVNLQDYVVFSTMQDLIREVIPFLEHRTIKGKQTVRLLIKYRDRNARPKAEPLYIIDGILTKNTELFLDLKPADLVTVKLINDPNKLMRLGKLGQNGVVLVTTKKRISEKVKSATPYLKVVGVESPLQEIKSFDSTKKNPKIPEMRSTLYWNPSVKVGEGGNTSFSFYTTDDIGTFKIKVRGVTSEGEPCEAFQTFEVKFNFQN